MSKYDATDKKTDEGEVLYKSVTGKKGRPAYFVKVGTTYKAWKRQIVAKSKKVVPVVKVVEAPAPVVEAAVPEVTA